MEEAHHRPRHYWICIAALLAPSASRFAMLLWIHVVVILATIPAATAVFVSPALSVTRKSNRAVGILPIHRWGAIPRGRCHHWVLWMAEPTKNAGDDDGDSFILEKEYELLEQKITQRGEIEELLMAGSPTAPLLVNKPAAAAAASVVKHQRGFGGGFSASAAGKNRKKGKRGKEDVGMLKEQLLTISEEAKDHAIVLKNEGLVRIDRILSDSVTDKLRAFVYDIRNEEANKLIKGTTLQAKFPTIRRWDVSIPLFEYDDSGIATTTTTIAYQALQDVLQTTAVGETMSRFLGTDTAELYELASYISDPGSSRQVIHSDTPFFGTDNHNQPILCTCFVALQDIRMDMGPTLWLPRTNTYAIHEQFFCEDDEGGGGGETTSTPVKDQLLQTRSSVVGLLPKGSCVLFDSRLLHCGTSNKSENDSRALFFFSFKHPRITLSNPGGDTASIRSDLKGRFRLSDFLPRSGGGSWTSPSSGLSLERE